MSAKEQFLEDLKKEQASFDNDSKKYLVGVSVMRNHRQYFSPMKID
jgi:hypothetical protein